jgi:DNA-directed RNA polymerase specialized sigma24 family protein
VPLGSKRPRPFCGHLCPDDATDPGGVCAEPPGRQRDGGYELTLDDTVVFESRNLDLVALDDALVELAKLNPQQSWVVELRFVGGLSIEETAQVLGLSMATVMRKWSTARIWLHQQLSKS